MMVFICCGNRIGSVVIIVVVDSPQRLLTSPQSAGNIDLEVIMQYNASFVLNLPYKFFIVCALTIDGVTVRKCEINFSLPNTRGI